MINDAEALEPSPVLRPLINVPADKNNDSRLLNE